MYCDAHAYSAFHGAVSCACCIVWCLLHCLVLAAVCPCTPFNDLPLLNVYSLCVLLSKHSYGSSKKYKYVSKCGMLLVETVFCKMAATADDTQGAGG